MSGLAGPLDMAYMWTSEYRSRNSELTLNSLVAIYATCHTEKRKTSPNLSAFRKEVIHTVLYVVYFLQFNVFFPKNPETTCAEICEKQPGKKSAKSLFLACCQGGLAYVTLTYGSRTAFKKPQRIPGTACTLSCNQARSCLKCKIIIILLLGK